MNTRAIVGILVVLAFIIFGVTLYYSLAPEEEAQAPEETATEEPADAFVPQVVNALHEFQDGTHTIAGEIDLPTPCDVLEAEATVEARGQETDLATLQFRTINESEVCAQVVTPASFRVTFDAAENADITAVWNGQPVRLNLVEVESEENLDDFGEYFKG